MKHLNANASKKTNVFVAYSRYTSYVYFIFIIISHRKIPCLTANNLLLFDKGQNCLY